MEQTAQFGSTGMETSAQAAKKQLATSFRRRGMVTATMSGVAYGTYTAFMTLAMTLGVWGVWYGGDSPLSEFSKLFLLGALGAATTDACSAAWAVLIAIGKGKFGDVFQPFLLLRIMCPSRRHVTRPSPPFP